MNSIATARAGWTTAAHIAIALLVVATTALAITATTAAVAPGTANALCADTMVGTWRNINASTRSVTRVDLAMRTCGDQVFCDVETGQCTSTETTYQIRVYGKCHPTDCYWGERNTVEASNGWQRTAYQYAWAIKHVWVKTYHHYGRTYLRVWVNTDFTPADGRQDYISDEWMLK